MNSTKPNHPLATLISSALLLAGAGTLAITGAWAIALSAGSPVQAGLAVVTGALTLAIGIASGIPVRLLADRCLEVAPQSIAAGAYIRMSLAVVATVGLVTVTDHTPFSVALWMSGWYVCVLVLESILLVRHLRGSKPCPVRESLPC